MENQWFQAALWMGLALVATLISLRVAISVGRCSSLCSNIMADKFMIKATVSLFLRKQESRVL